MSSEIATKNHAASVGPLPTAARWRGLLEPWRLTRRLARCGEAAASLAGFECVTERSPGSESVYLHILRGARWRGIRLSCHAPAYECCHDYEQLLIARGSTAGQLAVAACRVAWLVRHGGRVVADPAAVADAIDRLSRQLSHGRRYRDQAGYLWRLDAPTDAWRPVGMSDERPSPPAHRGLRIVSPRVCCEVRHAMNVTAAWEAELTAGV
ncbi:MAG: hypothetical protein AAGJ46_02145 [Planctomycetota bacterium]